jgi:hypothetical protein
VQLPTIILAQKLLAIRFESQKVSDLMLQNLIKQSETFQDQNI